MDDLLQDQTHPLQQEAGVQLKRLAAVVDRIAGNVRRDGCFEAYDVKLLADVNRCLDLWELMCNIRDRIGPRQKRMSSTTC